MYSFIMALTSVTVSGYNKYRRSCFDCFAKWYDTVSLNESFMFGPIVFDKKDKYLIAMGKKRPSMDEISEFMENKQKLKKNQEKVDE